MRSLLALAALALTSCAVPAQVALQGDGTEQATTTTLSRFLYPDERADATCASFYGADPIPCREILAVCVYSDAVQGLTPKWPGTAMGCTEDSPTVVDVCLTVPEIQWAWYGYTTEECALEVQR
jgi:hypothetical protein